MGAIDGPFWRKRRSWTRSTPTTKTQAALTSARRPLPPGNPQIMPAHLLMALPTQNDGIAAPLVEAVRGVDPATRIRGPAPHRPVAQRQRRANPHPQLSESMAPFTAAQNLATEMDDEYVSTEHLLYGLASGDSDVAKLLVNHGAAPQTLREAFVRSAAAHASPARTPRAATRRWRSTPPT